MSTQVWVCTQDRELQSTIAAVLHRYKPSVREDGVIVKAGGMDALLIIQKLREVRKQSGQWFEIDSND